MFSGRCWSHIQDFQGLLDGASSFVGARLFQKCQNIKFPISEIYQKHTFKTIPGILDLFRYPGVSKDKNVGFGAW